MRIYGARSTLHGTTRAYPDRHARIARRWFGKLAVLAVLTRFACGRECGHVSQLCAFVQVVAGMRALESEKGEEAIVRDRYVFRSCFCFLFFSVVVSSILREIASCCSPHSRG